MNFDELRDAWAKEPVAGAALPPVIAERTGSAVTRIRRSMQLEFAWVIIGYAATLVFVLSLGPTRFSFLVICSASFVIVQTIYYFFRFFLFYRKMARYDLGLRKNLRQFVYELELNMEIYKTYAFCVMPVAFLLWIALMDASGRMGFLRSFLCGDGMVTIGRGSMLAIIAMLFLAQAVGVLFLHRRVWVRYGRYLLELKRVMAGLEED
jgi:hypothetical protein